MPLARYAIYRGGPLIYAPTADDWSRGWVDAHRPEQVRSSSVPRHPRAALPAISVKGEARRARHRGAAIIDPNGEAVAGRSTARKAWCSHDRPVGRAEGEAHVDVTGHYGREDVLATARATATSRPH